MKKLSLIILISIMLNGCLFTRSVYVPHGQAVRLREEVKGVKVWIKLKTGETVPSTFTLYEGWYCLPLEDD